jgi:beta-glucanase (GH16 family)
VGAGQEWPAGGEIDIMENYGGKILGNFATAANGRWTAAWDSASNTVSSYPAGWVDNFHVWELIWSPDSASILIDGVVLNTFNPSKLNASGSYAPPGVAPFQTFGQLLWLNLAIGGNAGGSTAGLPNETLYLVDYIRVHQKQHPSYRARVDLLDASVLRVNFQSVDGRRYSLKESGNLSSWAELTNLRGTGQTMSHTVSGAAGASRKFYKVEVDNTQWIDGDTP